MGKKVSLSVTRALVITVAVGVLISGLLGFTLRSSLGGGAGWPENYQGDRFSGEITNKDVPEGVYGGEVAYDENCHDVGGGLTGCNAGIRTRKFGLVDFYYEHDMDVKPCLAPPREVVLVVRENETFVQRKH